jgi:hypothetical protein
MNKIKNIAQLLVASWSLSEKKRIPTSHGVLDRALKDAYDAGMFPPWANGVLHFVDSRVGLQCVELPEILEWAQDAQLTTAPNPSYRYTEIQISDRVAEKLLQRVGVSQEDARKLGAKVFQSLKELSPQSETDIDITT